jgi:hypothetical protein
VVFLLASKPVNYVTTAVIFWDLLAMKEVVDQLREINPAIQIDIDYPLFRAAGEWEPGARPFEGERWHKHLTSVAAPSVISIGTPRANPASEVILAEEMYGCEPFAGPGAPPSLPFRFYWEDQLGPPSSFAAREGDLKKAVPNWDAHKQLDRKLSAVLVRESGGGAMKGYPIVYNDEMTTWDTYAIIATMRCQEGSGSYLIVIAGVEGPASLGAARALGDLAVPPIDFPDRPSKPRQYLVEFTARRKGKADAGPPGQDSRDIDPYKRLSEIP